MKREASVNLFQYWNRLRAGRPAPLRTEIEPADIKTLLGDTFILESDLRGDAVFRLAGTRLCAIYGRELKGFAFSSLWQAKDSRLITRLVHSVFEDKSVLVVTYDGITQERLSVSMELLLLPLDGNSQNRRALGIVSSETKPSWLGADPVTEASVESLRFIDPDRESISQAGRQLSPTQLFAPRFAEIFPAGEDQHEVRRIRHLLVLRGGRTG
jgi:hypothetical protein